MNNSAKKIISVVKSNQIVSRPPKHYANQRKSYQMKESLSECFV